MYLCILSVSRSFHIGGVHTRNIVCIVSLSDDSCCLFGRHFTRSIRMHPSCLRWLFPRACGALPCTAFLLASSASFRPRYTLIAMHFSNILTWLPIYRLVDWGFNVRSQISLLTSLTELVRFFLSKSVNV